MKCRRYQTPCLCGFVRKFFISHEDTEAQSLKNSVNRPDNRVFKISLAEVY